MNISPHFTIQEFVPKEIFDLYGAKSIWFVDLRLIEGMEWLRTYFNASITINNWHTGGHMQNRGFRSPLSTTGARLSQHKYGRACDFNVSGLTVPQTYNAIISDWDTIRKHTFFSTMEDISFTPTWTHLDGRNTGTNELLIVKP